MRTPKYGYVKQTEYRDRVLAKIANRYKGRALRILSLAGAYCFDNKNSIESVTLSRNAGSRLHIVDDNVFNVRKILSHLTKVNTIHGKGIIVYYGKYGKSEVILAKGTLTNYLKHMSSKGIVVDVFIPDYFCSLNYDVEIDLNILLENKLLSKKGSVFLTASENPRISQTSTYKRILSYSSGSNNYGTGMRAFLRKKMYSKGFKVLKIDCWKYKDNKSSPVRMWVADLQVSY